jgi:Transposase domain (DUF772)
MMGPRLVEQGALFYNFSIDAHVPADHLLRSIDRFVDLLEVRRDLAPFYSSMGRPSIDPELMMRMLIIDYCFGIRSERRLCEEVHLDRLRLREPNGARDEFLLAATAQNLRKLATAGSRLAENSIHLGLMILSPDSNQRPTD